MLQPPVLLADEPSSHQDASFRDRVWQQIGESAAAGTACLIATHEDEAAGYATRLWRITDGKTSQGLSARDRRTLRGLDVLQAVFADEAAQTGLPRSRTDLRACNLANFADN